jgi:hypothetical protein
MRGGLRAALLDDLTPAQLIAAEVSLTPRVVRRHAMRVTVFLHLRDGVTPASFATTVVRQITSGETKAWEVVRRRPLTIRHKGRFKSGVTIKTPPLRRRTAGDHAPPDLIATMTGKDAGFVLRYFAGLLAMKLGRVVRGFYVPVDKP